MPYTEFLTYDLITLFNRFEKGLITIPSFQRTFVWNKKHVIDLLTSIYKGFPIGSLLILKSNEEIFELSDEISEIKGRNFSNHFEYIIDGGQRLKTLYYSLYVDNTNKGAVFRVGFNLKIKQFVHLNNKKPEDYIVELTSIFSSDKFMDSQIQLSLLKDSETLLKEMNHLYSIFINYQIPVTIISDVLATDVIEMFQTLNTHGRALSKNEILNSIKYKK